MFLPRLPGQGERQEVIPIGAGKPAMMALESEQASCPRIPGHGSEHRRRAVDFP